MRKQLALVLSILALGLAGCSQSSDSSNNPAQPVATTDQAAAPATQEATAPAQPIVQDQTAAPSSAAAPAQQPAAPSTDMNAQQPENSTVPAPTTMTPNTTQPAQQPATSVAPTTPDDNANATQPVVPQTPAATQPATNMPQQQPAAQPATQSTSAAASLPMFADNTDQNQQLVPPPDASQGSADVLNVIPGVPGTNSSNVDED